jgi:hypothetical protein
MNREKHNEFYTDISQNGTRFRLTFITNDKNNFLAMQDLARKCIDGKEVLSVEKPKRYKNVGMSVEDRIYDMICDGCDQDPAMCHNQGYCEYDKEEIVEDDT